MKDAKKYHPSVILAQAQQRKGPPDCGEQLLLPPFNGSFYFPASPVLPVQPASPSGVLFVYLGFQFLFSVPLPES